MAKIAKTGFLKLSEVLVKMVRSTIFTNISPMLNKPKNFISKSPNFRVRWIISKVEGWRVGQVDEARTANPPSTG